MCKKSYDKILYNGNPLSFEALEEPIADNLQQIRIYNNKSQFMGIYTVEYEKNRLKVDKLFFE